MSLDNTSMSDAETIATPCPTRALVELRGS
jgi:hypothetical protein